MGVSTHFPIRSIHLTLVFLSILEHLWQSAGFARPATARLKLVTSKKRGLTSRHICIIPSSKWHCKALWKGRSVALSWVTWYCSCVNCSFSSASVGFILWDRPRADRHHWHWYGSSHQDFLGQSWWLSSANIVAQGSSSTAIFCPSWFSCSAKTCSMTLLIQLDWYSKHLSILASYIISLLIDQTRINNRK